MIRSASVKTIRPASRFLPRRTDASRFFSTASTLETEPEGEPPRKYNYFQNVTISPSGIALIKFDNPAKSVNTISFALKDEAKRLWESEIASDDSVRGVVFSSGKPDGFIAGADIHDIQSCEDKSQLLDVIEDGIGFFQQMKKKGVPLVAAINGAALGGGLEWALWCDYRICTDHKKTKLGLPEVKLGLLPGFGGTQNLFPLVGVQNAMDMMLTGKDIRPAKAKKMGLVDLVVAPACLERVAMETAASLADGTLKPKRKGKSVIHRIVEDTSLGQRIMFDKITKMVNKSSGGNYPAPFAIMECVKHGLAAGSSDSKYKFERESFVKLAQTDESEALIGIFDGMTAMKKHAHQGNAREVKKVAVMGAGLMGAGIAQVTAEKGGYDVILKDKDDAGIGRGIGYMEDNWGKQVARRRSTKFQHNINSSKVTPLTDQSSSHDKHFAKADMVIEAVFEDLSLKQQIVASTELITPDHCIFATNTSAIPISEIAKGAKRPNNIIGMHYFSPVPSMPLLEIIPHEGTEDWVIGTAFEVGTKQGKTCIVVKDVPGFYVNRCLGPFLVEVSALIQDGVSLEQLDSSMKAFGMPVGPITLADEVGIDVTSHVATFLSNADLGVRMDGGNTDIMKNMIDKGWLGKKSKQGFYTYDGKKKTISPKVTSYVKQFATRQLNLSQTDIQNRLVCRFVNEAAKCVEDGIIESPVVGDIGLVFGTGFAPFRGGPFRYLDQFGTDKYVDMMMGFAHEHGPQFEPCQILKDYAATGKKFHPK